MTQLRQQSGIQIQPHPIELPEQSLPADRLFGTLLFEVTLEHSGAPMLPGWTLRLWPQARLGDATLEAHADGPEDIDMLLDGLAAQGIYLLGPMRRRQG